MRYTEEEILVAWQKATGKASAYAYAGSPALRERFLQELRKEEPVLFGKEDLLEVTESDFGRMVVHGIFGMLGTVKANEAALLSKARAVSSEALIIRTINQVKKKREETYEVGGTYADAEDRLYRYSLQGFLQYILIDQNFVNPKKPLRKL